MTEPTDAHASHEGHAGDHGHEGPSVKAYFVVFGALCAFTAISFMANTAAQAGTISTYTSFAIILSIAVCKATLVAAYFMHLLVDWGKVFVMIVPALILGPMLVVVLLPDIVLAWKGITGP